MNLRLFLSFPALLAGVQLASAASLDRSTVTQVVNEAAVMPVGTTKERALKPQDVFTSSELMRTGRNSRVEMVAPDQTVTRVGANALFRFEPNRREIELQRGSVLFNSPTGKGGGTIKTAAATASVLGTTLMVAATSNGGFKVLMLEGHGKITTAGGATRMLQAGQLTFVMPGKGFGPVMNFQLSQQIVGSSLLQGFKRPIPSIGKIQASVQKQEQQIAKGELSETGVAASESPSLGFTSEVDTSASEAILDEGQDGVQETDGSAEAEMDEDGDGVADNAEDEDGDGVPDSMEDSDGDGVPDGMEDSDGDGVPDSADNGDDGDNEEARALRRMHKGQHAKVVAKGQKPLTAEQLRRRAQQKAAAAGSNKNVAGKKAQETPLQPGEAAPETAAAATPANTADGPVVTLPAASRKTAVATAAPRPVLRPQKVVTQKVVYTAVDLTQPGALAAAAQAFKAQKAGTPLAQGIRPQPSTAGSKPGAAKPTVASAGSARPGALKPGNAKPSATAKPVAASKPGVPAKAPAKQPTAASVPASAGSTVQSTLKPKAPGLGLRTAG